MRDVILNFLEATESAAINSASFVAKGNKNQLDAVAVRSLRDTINILPVSVNVVTGEGTIDNAPLLSMGEILGYGGRALDMAVDPVDGTSLAANGQANSVVSLSIAPQGSLQPLPDMYMEKMVCPVPYLLDMECSLEYNVRNVANALHKPTSELRVAVSQQTTARNGNSYAKRNERQSLSHQ
ncbi:fructose-bisphosphatase class II [Vibrio sp. CDRSL-10 TSBA]